MDEKRNGLDFGEAIRALKNGHKVSRSGWNGKGMHLYLEDSLHWAVRGGAYAGSERKYEPVIVMFTAQQKHQPGWLASQADMLATDWQIVGAS